MDLALWFWFRFRFRLCLRRCRAPRRQALQPASAPAADDALHMTTVAKGAVEVPATGRATWGLVTWTATGVAHSASPYRKWDGADGGGRGGRGGADGTVGSLDAAPGRAAAGESGCELTLLSPFFFLQQKQQQQRQL